MTNAAPVYCLVGALAAFPRRLAAREVERRGGRLMRGVTRATTHVVFGLGLLNRQDDASIAARSAAERACGRMTLSETGFLRELGLVPASQGAQLSEAALLAQSRLAAADFEMLRLFDAFESPAAPFAFRDLILARKYAGLIAGGSAWGAIARSLKSSHRTALPARTLHVGADRTIYAVADERLCELDGQLLLGFGEPGETPDELFSEAEAEEEAGRLDIATALYGRCLAHDPGDAVAAFNQANCLRACGLSAEAEHGYLRAVKLDNDFVEAWFNLAGLARALGRIDTARSHLSKAVAIDPAYSDAVYNLATLEFEAGDLAAAARWWRRYLELDTASDWALTAARGLRFVALQSAQGIG